MKQRISIEQICRLCPNGCRIETAPGDPGTLISGNFCAKGCAFAAQSGWGYGAPYRQLAENFSIEEVRRAVSLWGREAVSVQEGSAVQGSPERSLRRTVFTDSSGVRYILEQIESAKRDFRESISEITEQIVSEIPLIVYERGLNGRFVQSVNDEYYQIQRFETHTPLDRDTFWQDSFRGTETGKVLVRLASLPQFAELPRYSPKEWYLNLLRTVQKNNPALFHELAPIRAVLDRTVLPVIETLPRSFSHGDCHPLNMLWSESKITAVIDWEFCGIRPRIYDAALVIGCVGTESPESLNGPFITALKEELRRSQIFTDQEQELLPAMILLCRFNWLSEWLRRKDSEMIEFELNYMEFTAETLRV